MSNAANNTDRLANIAAVEAYRTKFNTPQGSPVSAVMCDRVLGAWVAFWIDADGAEAEADLPTRCAAEWFCADLLNGVEAAEAHAYHVAEALARIALGEPVGHVGPAPYFAP